MFVNILISENSTVFDERFGSTGITGCTSYEVFLETVRKGFIIVPMVGTHTTKHWYKAYQRLVRLVPLPGTHTTRQWSGRDTFPVVGMVFIRSLAKMLKI
ncbi:MAG: hypothetical protein SPI30_06905 [Prevotella sp.]|nr:hypothetical protein [Prevotella sp.]